MANAIVELLGALSIILALIVINFLLLIYISVKRQGGALERRHIFVIGGVALAFFLVGILLFIIGESLALGFYPRDANLYMI